MAALDWVSLLVGVLGTLVATWATFTSKQLLRPKFSVEIGISEAIFSDLPKRYWPRSRNPLINGIAVGVTALEAQYVVLPLCLWIRNRGSLPVSDVDVVLEFPVEALIDETGIVGPVAGKMAKLGGRWPDGRQINRFQGMAQCRIPLGLLRPGENMMTGEFIQLKAGLLAALASENAAAKAEMLRQRYSSCEQLRAALEVRISIWSSSLKPISLSVMVVWMAVKNKEELEQALGKMARLSAASGPIEPGVYLLPLPWSRVSRDEFVEMAMVKAEAVEDLAKALSFDGMLDSALGVAVLRVPPWGLWGEAFDIEAKGNAKLLRRLKT